MTKQLQIKTIPRKIILKMALPHRLTKKAMPIRSVDMKMIL